MTDLNLQFVEDTAYGLKMYASHRRKEGYDREFFEDMICYIMEVLSKWTGQTWVGQRKDKETEMSFQKFFEALAGLLGHINFCETIMSDDENTFATMAMYNGIIYRYLGSNVVDNKGCVEIEYNDIYVSWSKNNQNDYIESKLYGPQLWIKAHTSPFDYAIDLEGIDKFYQKITGDKEGVVKGNEREVVYPTRKECILEVKEI